MLDTEPFDKTFGKKSQRKRPNVKVADLESLAKGKIIHYLFSILIDYALSYLLRSIINNNNAVKMCIDSQSLSSIPSNLLVYVLRIVKT